MSKHIEEVMGLVDAHARRTYAHAEDADSGRVEIEAKLRELLPVWQPIEASQAQRVPMTDAQIHDWWRSENSLEDCDMCRFADFAQVVRAFELKYGITQAPEA